MAGRPAPGGGTADHTEGALRRRLGVSEVTRLGMGRPTTQRALSAGAAAPVGWVITHGPPSPAYSALNSSVHRWYAMIISWETLGFRRDIIC